MNSKRWRPLIVVFAALALLGTGCDSAMINTTGNIPANTAIVNTVHPLAVPSADAPAATTTPSTPIKTTTTPTTIEQTAPTTTHTTTTTNTAPASAPNGTYINSDGNVIPSPYSAPSAPAGATAICRDGTYSFSQHHSGTCSHHNGVQKWL